MPDQVIKAHSIHQEYWYIARTRCSCGGAFESIMQCLGHGPSGPADVHEIRCKSCGAQRSITFDISEFFGSAHSNLMALSEFAGGLSDERLRDKLRRMIGPPMETTLRFVLEMAETGDRPGLEYLEETIRSVREKTGTAATAEAR